MRNYFIFLLLIVIVLSSCGVQNKSVHSRTKGGAKSSSPSGKYRNPTIFSSVNPFQGRAKTRLAKSKRKKFRIFKKKRQQNNVKNRNSKANRRFSKRKRLNKNRLKSSGSRSNSKKGGNNKKGKNLFDTKKE